jgi:hypothetical protein
MRLVETTKIVQALAGSVPSSTTPDYVSLKDYSHVTAIINVDNATTVTGSAITLHQATAVAGTSEKALAFSKVWANVDTSASDALVETAVVSSTFTPPTTNNLNTQYVIEVDVSDLDINNGFDCLRVGTANAVAQSVSVTYILSGARYQMATPPAAITD